MSKRSDVITVFGYHSHETDFRAAFDRLIESHRDTIVKVSSSLFNVHVDPAATSFCSVFIHGHSDRDDTPGLTSEQRRDSESAASFDRAISFDQFLLADVNSILTDQGLPTVNGWQDVDRVFVISSGIGASQLTFKTPQNETERQRNRRLEIFVNTVDMNIIQDADPKILDAS